MMLTSTVPRRPGPPLAAPGAPPPPQSPVGAAQLSLPATTAAAAGILAVQRKRHGASAACQGRGGLFTRRSFFGACP